MARAELPPALRDALAGLAAQDVEAVVAEARALARERARALLADALTGALVEHAGRRLGGATAARRSEAGAGPTRAPAEPAPAPPQHEVVRTGARGWYLYGVAAAGAAPPSGLAGIDGRAPVVAIEAAGLAAWVSEVDLEEFGEEALRRNLEDVAWLEARARAHEGVLAAATASAIAVVPMRLCTIYRSRAAVEDVLRTQRAELAEALARLAGATEWGVKVYATAAEPAAEPVAAGSTGTSYLRRRQHELVARETARRHAEAAAAAIHERLAALTRDARRNPLQDPRVPGARPGMVLNAAYLVAERDAAAFHAAVAELGEAHRAAGLELEATGPWPAYNFVSEVPG